MKRILICLCLFMVFAEGWAQSGHFVFIQQRSNKPFYVRIEDQSFSSSASGHLILSGLKDSVYNMLIGFPGGSAEQFFTIDVFGKNRGFIWDNERLTDLQNGLVLRSEGKDDKVLTGPRKNDTYSLLMAGVVHDTAVLYETNIKREIKQVADSSVVIVDSATRQTIPQADSVVKKEQGKTGKKGEKKPKQEKEDKAEEVKEEIKTDVVKPDEPSEPPMLPILDPHDVVRYGTENLVEGKLMIFLDRTTAVTDTIRLIIPRL